jgi:DNA-binding MarR family transcriptional regulator
VAAPPWLCEIAGECVAVRVRLLNRLVTGIYDAALRPHGLGVGQSNVLGAVGFAGPLTPTALARVLVMDKSTLTRDVRPLLAKGWLRKGPGPDKRSHTLELTAAGRAKLAATVPAWRAAQAEVRQVLGDAAVAGVFAGVERVWAALDPDHMRPAEPLGG